MSLTTATPAKATRKRPGNSIGMLPPKRTRKAAPKKAAKNGAKKAAPKLATGKPLGKRHPRVEFKQDSKGEFRWHFVSNGRLMADSGEGYRTKQGALRAWDRMAELIRTTALNIQAA